MFAMKNSPDRYVEWLESFDTHINRINRRRGTFPARELNKTFSQSYLQVNGFSENLSVS